MDEQNTARPSPAEFYEIRVRGHLSDRWSDWIDVVELHRDPSGETVMIVRAPDQAALHGVLARLQALACHLVSVNPVFRPQPPGG